MKPALLVIDVQNWFFRLPFFSSPEGLTKLGNLVEMTNELIDLFHGEQLPLIHILTVHKKDGSTRDLWSKRNDRWVLIEGTEDVEELPEVQRFETDIVIKKTRGNSFLRTDLEETLRNINVNSLVISGYSTNRCVGITAMEASERDFDVFLAQDAILGANQDRAEVMLGLLKNEFGIVPIPDIEIIEKICL